MVLAISLSSASIFDDDDDLEDEEDDDDDDVDEDRVRPFGFLICLPGIAAWLALGSTTLVTLVRLDADVRLVIWAAWFCWAWPGCCCEFVVVEEDKLSKSVGLRVFGLFRKASGVIKKVDAGILVLMPSWAVVVVDMGATIWMIAESSWPTTSLLSFLPDNSWCREFGLFFEYTYYREII